MRSTKWERWVAGTEWCSLVAITWTEWRDQIRWSELLWDTGITIPLILASSDTCRLSRQSQLVKRLTTRDGFTLVFASHISMRVSECGPLWWQWWCPVAGGSKNWQHSLERTRPWCCNWHNYKNKLCVLLRTTGALRRDGNSRWRLHLDGPQK